MTLTSSATNAGRRKAAELPAFLERLRQGLDARGMSRADLARELGVGVATVSEWFTRGRVPHGDVMLRLPHALGVNGHWLLTGEGPRELEWGEGDAYLRGVRDTLARMGASLDEVARHFGTASGDGDGIAALPAGAPVAVPARAPATLPRDAPTMLPK